MEEHNDNNKIFENECNEEHEFKFNFINMPWDDRTNRSKIGIITLLVSIFVAIMACVLQNILIHFVKGPVRNQLFEEISCQLVKMDEFPFAARIHSVDTLELLCVGAVVSSTSVLANGVCIKSGPVRLRIGTLPRCRKGFAVDSIEPFVHEGAVSKNLVLLTANTNLIECSEKIAIGQHLNMKLPAYIIGRPIISGSKLLSRQPAKLTEISTEYNVKKRLSLRNTICVTDLSKCPVRAGDLLVQAGKLFGLASTSTPMDEQSNVACFADLRVIRKDIRMF